MSLPISVLCLCNHCNRSCPSESTLPPCWGRMCIHLLATVQIFLPFTLCRCSSRNCRRISSRALLPKMFSLLCQQACVHSWPLHCQIHACVWARLVMICKARTSTIPSRNVSPPTVVMQTVGRGRSPPGVPEFAERRVRADIVEPPPSVELLLAAIVHAALLSGTALLPSVTLQKPHVPCPSEFSFSASRASLIPACNLAAPFSEIGRTSSSSAAAFSPLHSPLPVSCYHL